MSATTGATFIIWHGSRRWDGDPEIRAAKKGRAEWGAGIYGSTHFETASKYARGGGKVRLLEIQKTLVLEQTCLPLEVVKSYVNQNVPRSIRGIFLDDCERSAERTREIILTNRTPVGNAPEGATWLHSDVLRNLMVNYELASGKRGVTMAEFLTSLGIGLSLEKGGSMMGEQWMCCYDPKLIVSWEPHTYASAEKVGHILDAPDAHTTDPVKYLRRRSSFAVEEPGYGF